MTPSRPGFCWSHYRLLLATGIACAFILLLQAHTTHAQSRDEAARAASARALFEDGVQLAERGRWADAEDRFRRALSLRVSPVIAYNLASVLVEQNELVEASELLRRVLADANAEVDLKASASALQTKASADIGRVVIDVRAMRPGDRVQLDDRELMTAQLGVEMPIDPGSHRLQLERSGRTLERRTFHVVAGRRQAVKLRAVELAPAASQLSSSSNRGPAPWASQPADPVDHGSSSILASPWFWAGAALVVVAGASVAIVAASGGRSAPEQAFHGNVPPGSLAIQVKP